jgi:hypothetical protein
MKTEIFNSAIKNRNRLKFLYGLDEILIEPYYLTIEKNGSKVIYGKVFNSSEIKKFNFSKIANIKVLDKKRFSPIIPIIPMAS